MPPRSPPDAACEKFAGSLLNQRVIAIGTLESCLKAQIQLHRGEPVKLAAALPQA
jgi:hypothetical protein